MLNIDNELILLEKYKLTPTELFTVRLILLAREDNEYEYLQRFSQLIKLREVILSLQEKGIILKSWKLPKEGQQLIVEDIPFNQNFQKQFFRASYEIGEELFNNYPQFLTINGVCYNARRVSKKYNDLEDAFSKYGKAIKNSPDIHRQIIDDLKWAVEDGNYPFTTLDDFIADRSWTALHSFRVGDGINVNNNAIKMI